MNVLWIRNRLNDRKKRCFQAWTSIAAPEPNHRWRRRQNSNGKQKWQTKIHHITLLLFSLFSPAQSQTERDVDFFHSLSRCQLLSIYRIDTCVCLTASNPHAINSNTNKSINMQEVFPISLSLSCMFVVFRSNSEKRKRKLDRNPYIGISNQWNFHAFANSNHLILFQNDNSPVSRSCLKLCQSRFIIPNGKTRRKECFKTLWICIEYVICFHYFGIYSSSLALPWGKISQCRERAQ